MRFLQADLLDRSFLFSLVVGVTFSKLDRMFNVRQVPEHDFVLYLFPPRLLALDVSG